MSIAMVVGYMIGSGIFLLPTSLAPYGRNAVIAWGVTILGTLSLSLARLAAHVRSGRYAYIERAFGEKAAYLQYGPISYRTGAPPRPLRLPPRAPPRVQFLRWPGRRE